MRTFAEYLTESAKKYMFRVKVATELSKECLDKMRNALSKYDLDDMSEPKGLPIQQKVYGFEHLNNPEIYIIDVVTNYPCTPYELQALIHESTGTSMALIMVLTPGQEVIAAPIAGETEKGKAILDKDLPKQTYPQMLADLENVLANKETKYQYTYAAKESKTTGKTTNDLPQGKTSPVGTHKNKIPDPYKKQGI
jgi:hypothetical protein